MEGAGPALFAAADAERGTIASKSAECGGDANRTSGVGADGCESGSLLHARCCAGGAPAGEQGCVAGLDTVAVVVVFAGDAVGELVEVSFSGDDCACIEETLGHPRVISSALVELRVVAGGTARYCACYIEAVFD